MAITGDDQGNALTVLIGPNSVILTPDGSTAVNGQATGAVVVLQGAAKSLAAKMAGGDDLGAGNDVLALGKDPFAGGDAKSKAVFSAAGNKIDGGAGLNYFDGHTPSQKPSQYAGLIATDFLNWTDPNP